MENIFIFINQVPVGIYGIILLTYLFLQIFFSIKEKNAQSVLKGSDLKEFPFISILLPYYNESRKELVETIDSLLNLNYPKNKYEILVMDDGSKERYMFFFVRENYKEKIKIFQQENKGKREAQMALLNHANKTTDYFLTIDSDSILDKNCLLELVKTAKHFNCQAVSGGILVKNSNNFLNKLLRVRYWLANWQERLSQSYFNQVSCCSGPCSLWDAKTLFAVKEKYLNQIFLGKKCTYGDDRHLTNLFLKEGCRIKMSDMAYCYTTTPSTFIQWTKQQTRWSKSFYRESLWSYNNLKDKVGWYYIYQNLASFILPFLLILNILIYTIFYNIGMEQLLFYFASISIAGFIRGLYAFIYTKDPTYFLSPVYGFVHFIIVFPIRILALFQLTNTGWGTR